MINFICYKLYIYGGGEFSIHFLSRGGPPYAWRQLHETCSKRGRLAMVVGEDGGCWGSAQESRYWLAEEDKNRVFRGEDFRGAAGGRLGASRDFLERRPQETLRVGDTQKMRRDRGEHAEASSWRKTTQVLFSEAVDAFAFMPFLLCYLRIRIFYPDVGVCSHS